MKARAANDSRWRRVGWLAVGLVALAFLPILLVSRTMREPSSSGADVTVLLTLDRTWWHRLGLSRLTYVRSLRRAGAQVRVLNDSALGRDHDDRETARRLLDGVDALVLSGGGDVDPMLYGGDPALGAAVRSERDRFELALLAEAEARGLPILGICRGAQLLNVARGGTLRTIRSSEPLRRRHARYRGHPVVLEPGTRLARLLGADRLERVVSYHGQAVETPGEGLVIAGRAEDGGIEAIERAPESQGAWLVGVQWHPELSQRSRFQRRLFRGLVDAARRPR